MLTERDAVAIYEIKVELKYRIMKEALSPRNFSSLWGQTGPISKRYGVSARTVKYIWNRQTWAHVTNHLWDDEPEIEILKKKCRLPEKENFSPSSKTRCQPPKVWTAELMLPDSTADRFNPDCIRGHTAPSPTCSMDKDDEITSGTADIFSENAPLSMPPLVDWAGEWQERLDKCTYPRQIATSTPESQSCINTTAGFLYPHFSDSSAPAVAAAIHTAVPPEHPSQPWLDPSLVPLGADPFHADWPHW
jgi:hypothetical protein